MLHVCIQPHSMKFGLRLILDYRVFVIMYVFLHTYSFVEIALVVADKRKMSGWGMVSGYIDEVLYL